MSSGGGGQSGITRYDWNDTMARYYQGDQANPGGWLQVATNEAWKPYQGYSGQRVYGIDPYQDAAMQGIYDIALRGGAPDTAAGRGAAQDFASGNIANSSILAKHSCASSSPLPSRIHTFSQGPSPWSYRSTTM